MTQLSFEQRVCLVTGSSRGIGFAIAKALAKQGAMVVLHGRQRQQVDRQRLVLDRASQHAVLAGDLATLEGINSLPIQLSQQVSKLDVLIHCAGVLGARVELADYPLSVFNEVLQVNLTAAFRLTQGVLPQLRKGYKPVIVFVSSGVGQVGKAGWGAYAVSKFGIEGLAQIWASELREEGIRVVTVNPGGTRTAMRALAYPEEDPLDLPTADEIAPIFVELTRPQDTRSGIRVNAYDHLPFAPSR